MGANELLFWLSARTQGSWAQFRSAVDQAFVDTNPRDEKSEDRTPIHQRQRFNLQSLGHVEFDAEGCEDGWRVTPPVLALCNRTKTASAVLCGARLPETLRKLEETAKTLLERHAVSGQPDVIQLRGVGAESLFAIADQAELRTQEDAPAAILSCLPHIDAPNAWKRAELPFGKDWQVSKFEIGRRSSKWVETSVEEATRLRDGLLQFKRFQTPQYFLAISGCAHKVPGQMGKFFLLAQRQKRALRYNSRNSVVVVPAIFRPPLLVDRALVLCSGFLPQLDIQKRTLTYRDVPENIAALAADILRQPGI